jgi:phosphoribosyl 1,2-cyclic phosphate phosphodiesterase
LGFRIGDFAYITDAKTIAPEEYEKLRGVKVLVLNALRKEEHLSHLNLEEATEIVKDLKPEKAYFTHISHLMGTHEEVSKELPENISIAHDGLKISV